MNCGNKLIQRMSTMNSMLEKQESDAECGSWDGLVHPYHDFCPIL